jgi:hypothetical protein
VLREFGGGQFSAFKNALVADAAAPSISPRAACRASAAGW